MTKGKKKRNEGDEEEEEYEEKDRNVRILFLNAFNRSNITYYICYRQVNKKKVSGKIKKNMIQVKLDCINNI